MNNPITAITTAETSSKSNNKLLHPNLDLQLSTPTTTNNTSNVANRIDAAISPKRDHHHHHENHSTHLQLSIGSSDMSEKNESNRNSSEKSSNNSNNINDQNNKQQSNNMALLRVQEQAREHLRIAMAEKAYAEEARKQAKRQIELAEQEFTNAKRIRQQAQVELDKAYALKEHAMKQINSTMLQITCHGCKQQFQARNAATTPDENSLVLSYVSSAITTEGGGEVENDNNAKDHGKDNN